MPDFNKMARISPAFFGYKLSKTWDFVEFSDGFYQFSSSTFYEIEDLWPVNIVRSNRYTNNLPGELKDKRPLFCCSFSCRTLLTTVFQEFSMYEDIILTLKIPAILDCMRLDGQGHTSFPIEWWKAVHEKNL